MREIESLSISRAGCRVIVASFNLLEPCISVTFPLTDTFPAFISISYEAIVS